MIAFRGRLSRIQVYILASCWLTYVVKWVFIISCALYASIDQVIRAGRSRRIVAGVTHFARDLKRSKRLSKNAAAKNTNKIFTRYPNFKLRSDAPDKLSLSVKINKNANAKKKSKIFQSILCIQEQILTG